ncbi:MAG: hypothetical protein L0271_07930 [Gemmatimonadetes bacterium]|nr:hypothetical protein [Gemmatimonadota bacterium]
MSQYLIISAWTDARFGTVANIIVFLVALYGFASRGPVSFRAEYEREVRARSGAPVADLVSEADLSPLPEPVQRYLRLNRVVGQPRVRDFTARWRGRIRATATDPWMEFVAEQHNFPREPARFFLMAARRNGLPVDVFHAFHGGTASMRVRLLSVFPLVTHQGPDLDRAETVTVLNDLCLLAPAALIDPAIRWEPIDAHSVRVHYAPGAHTVTAELRFNDAGELIDFVSDDRLVVSADGKGLTRQRWSTPWGEYRNFGSSRVGTRGEGRWHAPDGEFVYIELELLDLQMNRGG